MKLLIKLILISLLLLFSGCFSDTNISIVDEPVVVLDYAHHEIHEGDSFILSDQQTLNNGGVYTYVIDTTNSENRIPHLIVLTRSTGEANLLIYENVTYTGGTANGEVNRNRVINRDTLMTIIQNPTINTRGTKLLEEHYGSGQNLGGDSRNNLEFNLDINQTYSIEFTSEANNNDISWLIEWYEDPITELDY